MVNNTVLSNRQIDTLIAFGEWEMEQIFGLSALSQYLQDLEMMSLQHGMKPDYAAQRNALLSSIWNENQRILSGHSVLSNNVPRGSIAHVQMKGVMRVRDGLSSRGANSIAQDLIEADKNPNIIATILDTDSGGGEAMAGTIIQNTIKELEKPVVVFGNTIASAALKAVLPANRIFIAGQEAKVGSVGTMMTINKNFVRWFQENMEDLYAEDSPKKNLEFREYLKGNKGPMVEMLTDTNQFFKQAVLEFRNIKSDKDLILGGKVFNGQQALDNGLVDGITTFNSAIEQTFDIGSNPSKFGSFFQLNINSMKTDFLKNLIQGINAKFKTAIPEDADQEAVLTAVEQSEGIEALQNTIVATVLEQIEKKPGTKVESPATKESQTTETDDTAKKLEALQKQFDAQAKQIEKLQEEKKELATQLVEFTGKVDDRKGGQANNKDFNTKHFQSMNDFMKAQPEGTSKF